MQLGMVGLGRMGMNMVTRLIKAGHQCVGFDSNQATIDTLTKAGGSGATTPEDFVKKLATPRVIWLMVPAAVVDDVIAQLLPHLQPDDVLIDGGNSFYQDDIRRAEALKLKNIHYLDVGTSGGVWGADRGYCLMIGGSDALPAAKRSEAPPSTAISTAALTAPATSSKWSTTASSTA